MGGHTTTGHRLSYTTRGEQIGGHNTRPSNTIRGEQMRHHNTRGHQTLSEVNRWEVIPRKVIGHHILSEVNR